MTNQLTHTHLDTTSPPIQTVGSTRPSPTPPDRPRNGLRRMLLASGAGLAMAAAFTIAILGNDAAEPVSPAVDQRPGYLIIQDEIDAALAERDGVDAVVDQVRPAAQIIQDEIDAALAEHESAATAQRPPYLILQNEIDWWLAERDGARSTGD